MKKPQEPRRNRQETTRTMTKLSRKTIRGSTTRTTTKLTRAHKNSNEIDKKKAPQEPRRNRQETTRTTAKSTRNHKKYYEIEVIEQEEQAQETLQYSKTIRKITKITSRRDTENKETSDHFNL
ncbi:hypothetical protein Glove_16g88 [Diversispora epigaea]|uniref:Uncharacterized protein n=1 Tax=Diversispora epigaea TaxID=1348612 RepID=A0A397JQZ8_9GLOM|nr:hypothetical protein Glove_16g88 [Diversispora epigaea]